MSMRTYSIAEEPAGAVYKDLLDAGARFCRRALVVVRPSIVLADAGGKVLELLRAWNGTEQMASEWPGTRLLKGTAALLTFDLNRESLLLLRSVPGLYSWQQPDLPEDLCLLRADGTPWLVSISHENDAYLNLEEAEAALLRKDVPGLVLVADHM